MKHTLSLSIFMIVVGVVGFVSARDASTVWDRLKAIQKEVVDADAAYRKDVEKFPENWAADPKLQQFWKESVAKWRQRKQEGFDAALKIAKLDPASGVALAALEWILVTETSQSLRAYEAAFGLLAKHHANNPKIAKCISDVAYNLPWDSEATTRAALSLLKAVVEHNPDRTTRGQAAIGLARAAFNEFTFAESKSRPDTNRLAEEAEKALAAVVRDFGDCQDIRRGDDYSLGAEAKRMLFETGHLRIGHEAPDIAGSDLAAVSFKLSDYRGKVVLLVFWASWCGPCMGAVPHEKELVEHFKGRPFILIGVNSDETKEAANKSVEKHSIPWRSFWDGGKGPRGPIATGWNVNGWPTIYAIDAKGVIREKYLHKNRLDDALEKLVGEAEKIKVP